MFIRLWVAVQSRPMMDDRGASLVEYALLVALIAVAAIIAVTALGTRVSENFNDISNRIAPGGAPPTTI